MTQPNENGNAAASKANAVAVSVNAICDSHRRAYGNSPGLMTSIGITFLESVRDELETLTTERNALAEKVKAMEDDAEVGRLVREALSSKPTPVSIKVIQKSPSCCAVEVPWCSQFGAGETVLEALQALFQGEEL